LALTACSSFVPATTLDVNGWTVTCASVDLTACRDVATAGIQFVFQARPTGVVSVVDRPSCPRVTVTSDGGHCWQVAIPIGSTTACIVVARMRPVLYGFEIVAADAPGRTPIGDAPSCS
jgi:hypothetical protein